MEKKYFYNISYQFKCVLNFLVLRIYYSKSQFSFL